MSICNKILVPVHMGKCVQNEKKSLGNIHGVVLGRNVIPLTVVQTFIKFVALLRESTS